MPKLTIGLAANRTSFYDKITNVYLTLDKPVQELNYTKAEELTGITHALCASVPALRLYEGQLPNEAIEAWKSKYMKPFNTDMSKLVRNLNGDIVPPAVKSNRAFDRPEQVNDASTVIPDVLSARSKQEDNQNAEELKEANKKPADRKVNKKAQKETTESEQ